MHTLKHIYISYALQLRNEG